MKSCYCQETGQAYPSVKDCLKALGISLDVYNKVTTVLRRSSTMEINGYHIGYSQADILKDEKEWVTPFPDVDLEINRKGQVRKKSTKAEKTLTRANSGYLYFTLTKGIDRKTYLVHRVVAKAFLPDYREDLIVDHINGVREDNRVENLRVVTQSENMSARDKNNKPIYDELRRIILQYGYEDTLRLLKQL